ncbi:hypothetical protein ABEX55_22875 [Priestia endophytica]|uniref:C1q-like domain-containing protein n=1 Tax=Priestia endophytica TaxID=135735 RepID=UPI003D2930B3
MSSRPNKRIKRQERNNNKRPLLAPDITQGSNRPLIGSTTLPNQLITQLPTIADAENLTSAFTAFRNGPQEVPLPANTTTVLYTSESLDVNEEYNTATGEFIPQQTGLYFLHASVDFTPTTPGVPYTVSLGIFRPGSGLAVAFDELPNGNRTNLSVSRVIQLQAGSIIFAGVTSSIPGTINVFSSTSVNRFEGFRIQ